MVFVPLIDCKENAPPMPTASVALDSPDPLAFFFSEDGICLADGDWSKDYWDSYNLYACLRDHMAPAEGLAACVRAPPLESGEAIGSVAVPLIEAVGALPGTDFFAPPVAGFIPQDHTDALK
ncbi:unnamed protein product, partial [Timema podura]|nr:unnamed protein product [Timema podura]